MTGHKTGTREEWLAAGSSCSRRRKNSRGAATSWRGGGRNCRGCGSTRSIDSIPRGSASLADLFRGRSQLLVYHFMFGPDYTAGCPNCSAIADGFNGFVVHLANHDVMLWAVSRAPLAKLQAYKRHMGWTFPWASSFGGDFNFDFNVSFTEEQQREGGSIQLPARGSVWWRAGQEGGGEGPEPTSRPCAEPTRRRTIATGRA